ncbi:MAG: hypothetical protein ACKOW5_10060, partial [Actinomycetales bacterium]
GGLALCLVLAGCGGSSSEPDRQAAGEAMASGSKLCVKNSSAKTVSLSFGATLSPGQEQCKEGNSLTSSDINFDVQIDGVQAMTVEVNNPFLGMGWVKLTQPSFGQCLYESPMGQGKTSARADGLLRYQFERLSQLITTEKDPQQIQWTLTLSDPGTPSADGKPVKCS